MLFKIYMVKHFREEPDTIGFLEAEDQNNAVRMMGEDLTLSWAKNSTSLLIERLAGLDTHTIKLRMATTDPAGQSGEDIYCIEAIPHNPFIFNALNWQESVVKGE